MNNRMYEAAATQANLRTLGERDVTVIEPDSGALASRGEYGIGRLPAPARLLAAVESVIGSGSGQALSGRGPWDGLRVLITAGGTRERIDSVRYIGNRSSGRMGFALAAAAAARGASVTLIAANSALPTPPGVERIDVVSAAELAAAAEGRVRGLPPAPDGGGGRRLPAARGGRGQARPRGLRWPAPRARGDRRCARPRSESGGGRARP